MKKTETQEETLARLEKTSASGNAAAKRFTSLLKRSFKTTKSEADERLKALKQARKAS